MSPFSGSLLRHRAFPFCTFSPPSAPFPSLRFLLRVPCRVAVAAASSSSSSAGRDDPAVLRRPPPDKNFLRARDAVREIPAFSRELVESPDDPRKKLLPNQAIGLVTAAQANFMRVLVDAAGGRPDRRRYSEPDPRVGSELLCVVRAVLKKIGRRVLVGDKVLVGSVDWVDRRGMIEDTFKRSTELTDPPIANVDHLVVLFSMEQPRVEAFNLTRFLVEAESTGIPLTLALNKMELVGEEVWIKNAMQSFLHLSVAATSHRAFVFSSSQQSFLTHKILVITILLNCAGHD